MSRHGGLLLATALGLLAAASAGSALASGRVQPVGEIVFATDRATANPGEIYALTPGGAVRNVTHSAYADVALATSPQGRAFAFWSNRTGPWRLMIAPDGKALRSVVVGGPAGADYPPAPPVFSADGTQLLIPYLGLDSIAQRIDYAVASVRSGAARKLTDACGSAPVLSPDGTLVACKAPAGDQVVVADPGGRVRFTVPGASALWSPDGRLAVAGEKTSEVLSAAGRSIARVAGVASAWSRDGTTLALVRPGSLVLTRPGGSGAPHVVYRGGSEAPYWVAFTPDGSAVVFAGGLGGPQMAAVAGGRVRAFAGQPFGSWSHDGRYAFTVVAGGTVRIEIGDQLARKAKVVARMPYEAKGAGGLGWLGDGSAVLYDASASPGAELWTMRADGGSQRRLGGKAVMAPAWSRDGTKLAYASGDPAGGSKIVVADAQGRTLSVVPAAASGTEPNDGNPSWSPDGTRIAVDDIVAAGVLVADVRTGRRTPVAVDGVAPAWSPDGATIAFVDIDDRTAWGAAPNGADRHRLLPATAGKIMSLAWSPDGKQLAFSTPAGVYLATPDGASPATLVTKARNPGRPSFAPDGSRLAYAADAGTVHPHRSVYVVAIDGRGRRQLTAGPYDSGDPTWTPVRPQS
jgi:Tol biopolymer transport system component